MKNVFLSCSYDNIKESEIIEYLEPNFNKLDLSLVVPNFEISNGANISSSITELINKCSYFICFYSNKNPNITFELGYALGKNKKVIIVADYGELPFDMKDLAYINKNMPPFDIASNIISFIETENVRNDDFLKYRDSDDPNVKLLMLSDSKDLLDSIDGSEFEALVFDWFQSRGFKTTKSEEYSRYGYDFEIDDENGETILIEVKKYSQNSRVSVGTINQLLGSMSVRGASKGIIVSSSEFTKSAEVYALCSDKKILLLTPTKLISENFCL